MATPEDRDLGLHRRIDRRDFVGAVLAGASTAALGCVPGTPEPPASLADAADWTLSPEQFDGFGGEGDYERSNGNTWRVVNSAHRIRERRVDQRYACPGHGRDL